MKKDILKIFSSNLIKMMVTFITAFLIPMVLSVDDYGYYKVYTFYAAYIGILHCGYCDGIYLDYGGRSENEIKHDKISQELTTIFIYSVGLALMACAWGIIRHDFTITCLGLTIVPNIVYTFYSYIYQATGDFKKYTWMLNFSTATDLILNGLLVLSKVRDYRAYVAVCVSVQLVAFFIGSICFQKSGWIQKSQFSIEILIKYIKMGILLMLGNFAYTFFIGIDKWFIKFTLNIADFSMYSFASQMLTVVNMFITPISMTLYSYLSRKKQHSYERMIKQVLVTILMIMPIAIYAINIIISMFMTKYSEAINVVGLLLITQIFLSLNLAVFVNLYKVYKMQKKYIQSLFVAIIIAGSLDLIVAFLHPSILLYSVATLISCLVWLCLNYKNFKYLCPSVKEIIYVVVLLGMFFLSEIVKRDVLCAGAYILIYLVLTYSLMNTEWKYLKGQIQKISEKVIS